MPSTLRQQARRGQAQYIMTGCDPTLFRHILTINSCPVASFENIVVMLFRRMPHKVLAVG